MNISAVKLVKGTTDDVENSNGLFSVLISPDTGS